MPKSKWKGKPSEQISPHNKFQNVWAKFACEEFPKPEFTATRKNIDVSWIYAKWNFSIKTQKTLLVHWKSCGSPKVQKIPRGSPKNHQTASLENHLNLV